MNRIVYISHEKKLAPEPVIIVLLALQLVERRTLQVSHQAQSISGRCTVPVEGICPLPHMQIDGTVVSFFSKGPYSCNVVDRDGGTFRETIDRSQQGDRV